MIKPITGIAGCCARAASGQAAAEPTMPMKSRRRIAFPKAQTARLGFAITAGICDRRNGLETSSCTAAILSRPCPLWVNNCRATCPASRPLYPRKLPRHLFAVAAVKGRFCCRSPLQAFLVSDSVVVMRFATGADHDGATDVTTVGTVFYSFRLDEAVRRTTRFARSLRFSISVGPILGLRPITPEIGRPPIDPVLMMIRMLIVGYVFGIRSERGLCREVQVNLAYRWFCGLSIEDKVPDHSAFSRARNERFGNALAMFSAA